MIALLLVRLTPLLLAPWLPDARRCTAPIETHLKCAEVRFLDPNTSASSQESEWWTSSLGRTGSLAIGDGKLQAAAKLNRPHHAAALVRGFPILRSHMFHITAGSLSMKFEVAEVTN